MVHLRFHQNTKLGVFETGCSPAPNILRIEDFRTSRDKLARDLLLSHAAAAAGNMESAREQLEKIGNVVILPARRLKRNLERRYALDGLLETSASEQDYAELDSEILNDEILLVAA